MYGRNAWSNTIVHHWTLCSTTCLSKLWSNNNICWLQFVQHSQHLPQPSRKWAAQNTCTILLGMYMYEIECKVWLMQPLNSWRDNATVFGKPVSRLTMCLIRLRLSTCTVCYFKHGTRISMYMYSTLHFLPLPTFRMNMWHRSRWSLTSLLPNDPVAAYGLQLPLYVHVYSSSLEHCHDSDSCVFLPHINIMLDIFYVYSNTWLVHEWFVYYCGWKVDEYTFSRALDGVRRQATLHTN